MTRLLYGFIVLGGTLLGAILAYQVDPISLAEVPGFTGYSDPRSLLAVLLGGLGYLVSATMTWELERWIEHQLPNVKLRDVLLGSAGLVFGFLISVPILTPVHLFLTSPYVQTLLGPQVTGVIFMAYPIVICLFGYLGISVFVRKSQEMVSLVGGQPAASSKILDTSVIIDGRVVELIHTRLLEGNLLVPEYVISELHHISDAPDPSRRNRGRRGLDILEKLKTLPEVEVTLVPDQYPDIQEVDAKLVQLSRDTRGTLYTIDANLHKVALIKGVRSVNLNEIANALRPILMPDDIVEVSLVKSGKERGQGVGYLNDGTMVVVDDGASRIGQLCTVMVSRILKTAAGRMIFAVMRDDPDPDSDKVGMSILK